MVPKIAEAAPMVGTWPALGTITGPGATNYDIHDRSHRREELAVKAGFSS